MRVQRQDLDRLQKKLDAAKKTDVIEATVRRVGEHLLGQSIPLAPKDEGNLRGSGNSDPYTGPKGPAVRVGFDEEYAFVQHERLDFEHADGQAKYLEQPYLENKARYAKAIKQAAIKQARGAR